MAIDSNHLHIMRHATAWPRCFRNHFIAGPTHNDWARLQHLLDIGVMEVSRLPSDISGGDTVFRVTPEGMRLLRQIDEESAKPDPAPSTGGEELK